MSSLPPLEMPIRWVRSSREPGRFCTVAAHGGSDYEWIEERTHTAKDGKVTVTQTKIRVCGSCLPRGRA